MREIDIALIVSTDVVDDQLIAQIDGFGDGGGQLQPAVVLMPLGVLSRPIDPVRDAKGTVDPQQACTSLVLYRGGQMFVIPMGDPRVFAKMPNFPKGDRVFNADDGSFYRINAERHAHSFLCQTETDGPTFSFDWSPDGLFVVAPWGRLEFSPRGFHVSLANGARIDLGGIGLPAPFDQFGSMFMVTADIAHVAGLQTLLGVSASDTYMPAAHGLPTDIPPVMVGIKPFLSQSVKVAAP